LAPFFALWKTSLRNASQKDFLFQIKKKTVRFFFCFTDPRTAFFHPKENVDASEISVIIAAIGALTASVVYAFKNIRYSSCCGASCEQEVQPDNGITIQHATEV